jgi:signal transduction histidine kinase
MRIATKLTLLLLTAVVVVLAGFGYIRARQERRRLVADLLQDVRVQANVIKVMVEHALSDPQPQVRQDLLAAIEQDVEAVDRIWVFDRQLRGISGAASDLAGGAMVPPRAELEQVLQSGQPVMRYLDVRPDPIAYVILPLKNRDGGTVGVLEVLHLDTRVPRQVEQAAWDQVVRLGLLSLTIALVIFLAIRIGVRQPIGELVETAQALGRGDLSVRRNLRRRDEIGQLASAFDRMAESLQAAQARLMEEGRVRLELERQLQQAQKLAAVGRLASDVAHEISTPLNVISGRAEVIQKAVGADHPAAQHATVVLRQIERIGGIIRQLLDYTRPRRPSFRSVEAASALNRTVELLEPLASLRQIGLRAEAAEGLPPLLADADLLQQVLLNLVVNSLDATPPGGSIRLHASATDPEMPDARPHVGRGQADAPYVTLTVSDTGAGMSRGQLERIFEPFFSTKERRGGTGLGVPIVEDIVRSHRGAVEVRSAEGGGTTVLLRWPIAVQEPEGRPRGDTAKRGRSVASS